MSTGLVLCAAGSRAPAALAAIEALRQETALAFPWLDVVIAFRSADAVRHWRAQGRDIPEIAEAVRRLSVSGRSRLLLVNLSFNGRLELPEDACGMELRMTPPLLDQASLSWVSDWLSGRLQAQELNILVGHGVRDAGGNQLLLALAERLAIAGLRVVLTTLEGDPGTRHLGRVGVATVHLQPLFLFDGNHWRRDVLETWPEQFSLPPFTMGLPLCSEPSIRLRFLELAAHELAGWRPEDGA
jgi:cobalamin biosynthesis Co2+ chelatase CbiK